MRRWFVSFFAILLHVVVIDGRTATSSPPASPSYVDIPLKTFKPERKPLLMALAAVTNKASPFPASMSSSPAVCYTITGLVGRLSADNEMNFEIVLQRPRFPANLTGPIMCQTEDNPTARLVGVRDAAKLLGWDSADDNETITRLEAEEKSDEEMYGRYHVVQSDPNKHNTKAALSKTQKSVIFICSAVIGTFFVIAASLRFRNYLQRKAAFRKILRCDSPLRVHRLSSVRPSRRGRRLTETRLDTGVIDVDDGEVIKYLSATEQERRVQIEDVPTTYQIPSRRRRCSCPHDVSCTAPPRLARPHLRKQHSTSPIACYPPQHLPTVSRSSSSSQLPTALPLPHVDLPNASPRRAHAITVLPSATATAALAPAGLLSCRCRMALLGWTCAHRRFYQRMMNPLYDPSLRFEEMVREEKIPPRRLPPSIKSSGRGSFRHKVMEEEEEESEEEVKTTIEKTNGVEMIRVDICPLPPEEKSEKSDPPQRPSTAASV